MAASTPSQHLWEVSARDTNRLAIAGNINCLRTQRGLTQDDLAVLA